MGFLSGTLDNTHLRFNISKHKTATLLLANCFPLAPLAFHSFITAYSVAAIIQRHDLSSDAPHFLPGLWQRLRLQACLFRARKQIPLPTSFFLNLILLALVWGNV